MDDATACDILSKFKSMTFKEMEKEFNDALVGFSTKDDTEPSRIKVYIFDFLARKYADLGLRTVDYHNNKFRMEFRYIHGFQGIEPYDRGYVTIVFSIRAKRTDKLEVVSKTRNKYLYTMHTKPIVFDFSTLSSHIVSFDWYDKSENDITLTVSNWVHNNDGAKQVAFNSFNDATEKIKETYEKAFRQDVVQPYLKTIMLKNMKYYALYNALPESVKIAIAENDSPSAFAGLADFIVENNIIHKLI